MDSWSLASPLAGEAALAQRALEALQVAVALVDKHGVISIANTPCRRILARAEDLVVRETRLTSTCETDARALQSALDHALAGRSANATTTVSRKAGHRYSVCFVALAGAAPNHCLAIIVAPDAAAFANHTWRSLFDLSDTEISLASRILISDTRH